jgi:predicted DNA-binding antitoxin AbrB/MazE fold protein
MGQIVDATFENGVFKPDDRLDLPAHTRVRLIVEPLPADTEAARRQQAWEAVERLWQQSIIDSQGERLSRAQLHERR